ncbi:N-acetylglucosaminyl-phosphatidylinositol de-N-acetylase-like isoform X1 [Selaginella moellendorffii]|uniref:N-acetylglucosaminyl-phosphatidylinositol de-N-acetylase-like isoform X1 n=1 Tax=Selaginella moellendorffii TaxID=88036 RepID=UPI000D1CB4A8|nr:N-acetylglucosaminyl-phosphatidylinositol de-N-acetylase-like isoform X1 [Selaginella moellendorffii]|eukprot:XP_024535171.1 N-acetylglucosaminyl-phosphatidylinositol de-N-acetylase-like isoform X1 [Selaginella moellendorffii]
MALLDVAGGVALAILSGSVLLLVLLSLPVAGYFFSPRSLPQGTNAARKRNVLLVIAHPDDESMFFGPTLLGLASTGAYNVRVLCLSSGNVDGRGWQRKEEILAACLVLKVPLGNVEVMDVPELQDGFAERWDIELIRRVVQQRIMDHKITTLITFDSYGISGHPNHRSVHHAICALLLQLESNKDPVVEAWQLASSSLLRKFLGPLDVCISLIEQHLRDPSKHHCFYSQRPWTNARAMRQHRSQWIWYRKLFVIFSRYTYVNSLKQEVTKTKLRCFALGRDLFVHEFSPRQSHWRTLSGSSARSGHFKTITRKMIDHEWSPLKSDCSKRNPTKLETTKKKKLGVCKLRSETRKYAYFWKGRREWMGIEHGTGACGCQGLYGRPSIK